MNTRSTVEQVNAPGLDTLAALAADLFTLRAER